MEKQTRLCWVCKQDISCPKHPSQSCLKLTGTWIVEKEFYMIDCKSCMEELQKLDEDPRGAIIHVCSIYVNDVNGTKQKALAFLPTINAGVSSEVI